MAAISFYSTCHNPLSPLGMQESAPKSTTKTYVDKAFSVAAPRLWNALPQDMRSIESLDIFKSKLETVLFACSYLDF
jgi:hypothetical protein